VQSNFKSTNQYTEQAVTEKNPIIQHKQSILADRRYSLSWLLVKGASRLRPALRKYIIYRPIIGAVRAAKAVLSIGGDNYSLDYGIPYRYTDLDDLTLLHKKPLVLWGASVGPFSEKPGYEKYMAAHLRNATAIFARESHSVRYLQKIGVTENVYEVKDPAFAMPAERPNLTDSSIASLQGAIGLNFSPLLGRYIGNGDALSYVDRVKNIVESVASAFHRPVVLVYHVTGPKYNDDALIDAVMKRIDDRKCQIQKLPEGLSASEIKWLISRMDLFAGARMHATIAALSSGVPTLSFSYSIKSKGLNQDLFGHDHYCLSPNELEPERVVEKLRQLAHEKQPVQSTLQGKIPLYEQQAMLAGRILAEIID
jgi:polysaccharide pyruvyl transferase WcaK-like protein